MKFSNKTKISFYNKYRVRFEHAQEAVLSDEERGTSFSPDWLLFNCQKPYRANGLK